MMHCNLELKWALDIILRPWNWDFEQQPQAVYQIKEKQSASIFVAINFTSSRCMYMCNIIRFLNWNVHCTHGYVVSIKINYVSGETLVQKWCKYFHSHSSCKNVIVFVKTNNINMQNFYIHKMLRKKLPHNLI